jgi:ribA/ribD-fused uncharacterized protein
MTKTKVLSVNEHEDGFLGNFYRYNGFCVEHHFQAAKTLEPEWAHAILASPDPGEAKYLGNICPLRQDWEEIKFDVMRTLLRVKFTADPAIRARLCRTDPHPLEEDNTWGDRIWGTVDGHGQNMLGVLLMELRITLRSAPDGPRDSLRAYRRLVKEAMGR